MNTIGSTYINNTQYHVYQALSLININMVVIVGVKVSVIQ